MNSPAVIYLGNHSVILGKHIQALAQKLGYRLSLVPLFIESTRITLGNQVNEFHICGHTILDNVFSACPHCKHNSELLDSVLLNFVSSIKYFNHVILVSELYTLETIHYYDYILEFLQSLKEKSSSSFVFGSIYLYNPIWVSNRDNFFALYQITQGLSVSTYLLMRNYDEYLFDYSQSITLPSNSSSSLNSIPQTISQAHIKSLLKQDTPIHHITQILYDIACDLLVIFLPHNGRLLSAPLTIANVSQILPTFHQPWDTIYHYQVDATLSLAHWPYHLCTSKRKCIDVRTSLKKTMEKYAKYFHNPEYLHASTTGNETQNVHPTRYLYSNLHLAHVNFQYSSNGLFRRLLQQHSLPMSAQPLHTNTTATVTTAMTTNTTTTNPSDSTDLFVQMEAALHAIPLQTSYGIAIEKDEKTSTAAEEQQQAAGITTKKSTPNNDVFPVYLYDIQQFQMVTNANQLICYDYLSFQPIKMLLTAPSSATMSLAMDQNILLEQKKLLHWACPGIVFKHYMEEFDSSIPVQSSSLLGKGGAGAGKGMMKTYVPNSRLYTATSSAASTHRHLPSPSQSHSQSTPDSSYSSASSVRSSSNTNPSGSAFGTINTGRSRVHQLNTSMSGTTLLRSQSSHTVTRQSSSAASTTTTTTTATTRHGSHVGKPGHDNGLNLPISCMVYESMYTMILLESITKQCREMIQAEAYKQLFTTTSSATSLIAVSSFVTTSTTTPSKTPASPVTPVGKGKPSIAEVDENKSKVAASTTPTSQPKKKSFKNGFHHLHNSEKYLSYDDLKDCILIVDSFIHDMQIAKSVG